MKDKESTLLDKFNEWAKNNLVIVSLIILCSIIPVVGNNAETILKLAKIFKDFTETLLPTFPKLLDDCKQARPSDAIEKCKLAVKKAQKSDPVSEAYYYLGNAQYESDYKDEAIKSYKTATNLDPGNQDKWNMLISAQFNSNKKREGCDSLAQAQGKGVTFEDLEDVQKQKIKAWKNTCTNTTH